MQVQKHIVSFLLVEDSVGRCVCLQESRTLLYDAVKTSVDQVFCLGIKLVRGAYMDKERNLAEKEKRTDPIHESWENTNER